MFTIHERGALTAWGPGASSRAPGMVQGQSPGGIQGAASPEALGFSICKRPGKALLELFFLLSQPKSSTERFLTQLTVQIKF